MKKEYGAGRGTRTPDLMITNQLLYQLSYAGLTYFSYNRFVFSLQAFYVKNNKNIAFYLTFFLFSSIIEPMEHTFYHISKSIKNQDSFLKDGIRSDYSLFPSGGQSGGFFVFSTEQGAYHDFADFHFLNEGLLVSTKVDENDLKYPTWQHDLERNTFVKNLIISAVLNQDTTGLDKINNAFKNARFRTEQLDATITGIYPGKGNFTIRYENEDGKEHDFIFHGGDFKDKGDWTGLTQVLCDKLIKILPEFEKSYNDSLKKSLTEHWCLKYTGSKNLPIFEIHQIRKNALGQWEKEKTKQKTPPISTIQIAKLKGLKR